MVSRVTVADDAVTTTLQNTLWYESRFRDDLMFNTPPILEDAIHRATKFIEVEEERVAMAKNTNFRKH